jgi:hypothetical protein
MKGKRTALNRAVPVLAESQTKPEAYAEGKRRSAREHNDSKRSRTNAPDGVGRELSRRLYPVQRFSFLFSTVFSFPATGGVWGGFSLTFAFSFSSAPQRYRGTGFNSLARCCKRFTGISVGVGVGEVTGVGVDVITDSRSTR